MGLNLSKFVNTKTGKYIMSVLLGFGLATIFRKICKGDNCVIFYAPPLDEIENKIFKQDGKCYQYSLVSTKCDSSKISVIMEPKNNSS
jgi:hypothetical protein